MQLYVHRHNCGLLGTGSLGRPSRLAHSSWALSSVQKPPFRRSCHTFHASVQTSNRTKPTVTEMNKHGKRIQWVWHGDLRTDANSTQPQSRVRLGALSCVASSSPWAGVHKNDEQPTCSRLSLKWCTVTLYHEVQPSLIRRTIQSKISQILASRNMWTNLI